MPNHQPVFNIKFGDGIIRDYSSFSAAVFVVSHFPLSLFCHVRVIFQSGSGAEPKNCFPATVEYIISAYMHKYIYIYVGVSMCIIYIYMHV